jgi:hypothetical protein
VFNLFEDDCQGAVDYIGRESVLANPFVVGRDGPRSRVMRRYRDLLWQIVQQGKAGDFRDQPPALQEFALGCIRERRVSESGYRQAVWEALEGLRRRLAVGQSLNLMCYCKPLACHGDVLARYLKWAVRTPVRHA